MGVHLACTFLTGAVTNLPGSGKDVSKARVPMVISNPKEAGYEADRWRKRNVWCNL